MNWANGLGYAIVVLTHVYMLVMGLPTTQMTAHAALNLVAAGLFWYGYEMQ